MRLRSHHVALLTPLERKVYAPLIGKIDYDQEKKDLFISQSQRYVPGDEDLLPYPERSKRGVMLLTLCQQLAASSMQAAAVYEPRVPHNALHIKRKLLALGAERVYAVPARHLLAAVYGKGKSPFHYFRQNPDFRLNNLDPEAPQRSSVVCALNPLASTIARSSEYNIIGILLRKPSEETELSNLPLFAEAAHLGLLNVSEVAQDRFWLTSGGDNENSTDKTQDRLEDEHDSKNQTEDSS